MHLKIKRIDKTLPLPAYQTAGSVALDLYAAEECTIGKFSTVKIRTGLAVEIPLGYEGQIRPRSSTSANGVIEVKLGTIDSDYRGELMVIVSTGWSSATVDKGARIAQLVIAPIVQVNLIEVDDLTPTERGAGSFGSTGKL